MNTKRHTLLPIPAIYPLIIVFFSTLLIVSCKKGEVRRLKIVSWNVETFFDAVDDGVEYKEFRGNKTKWSETAYKQRLIRLCEALKEIDADVCVLLEIENENVIQDINNTFPLIDWGGKNYRYAAFDKAKEAAIGSAVLSRYPLEDLTVHNIDMKNNGKMPPLRSIMCVTVSGTLLLIVNHWKSKVGGVKETEKWRREQEGVLASLFTSHAKDAVIALGDFNRDESAFDKEEGAVRLRGSKMEKDDSVVSAWSMIGDDSAPGSYYYKGKWERIDNVFVNSLVTIDSFQASKDGDWATEEGRPKRYTVQGNAGYSDHLPLVVNIHW